MSLLNLIKLNRCAIYKFKVSLDDDEIHDLGIRAITVFAQKKESDSTYTG